MSIADITLWGNMNNARHASRMLRIFLSYFLQKFKHSPPPYDHFLKGTFNLQQKIKHYT